MFLPKRFVYIGKCLMANMSKYCDHRHLSNIDCLMAHPACLVCLISTVNDRTKKKEEKRSLGSPVLVAGT